MLPAQLPLGSHPQGWHVHTEEGCTTTKERLKDPDAASCPEAQCPPMSRKSKHSSIAVSISKLQYGQRQNQYDTV
jgi:hypothetical protein